MLRRIADSQDVSNVGFGDTVNAVSLCARDKFRLLGEKDRDGARLQGIETEGSEIVSVKRLHPCQRRSAPTRLMEIRFQPLYQSCRGRMILAPAQRRSTITGMLVDRLFAKSGRLHIRNPIWWVSRVDGRGG